jgi:hypothetical protein
LTAISTRVRLVSISRAVVGVLGAVAAVLGIAVAAYFGLAPVRITVARLQPIQIEGGEFDKTLTATGQTERVPTRVTCLPAQGELVPGAEPDAACLPRDAHRGRVALAGLGVFVAGAVVWQLSGTERSLLRHRTTST